MKHTGHIGSAVDAIFFTSLNSLSFDLENFYHTIITLCLFPFLPLFLSLFSLCVLTHQVDFFLQVVHILVSLLLALLVLAIGGSRQLVLIFASLGGRK